MTKAELVARIAKDGLTKRQSAEVLRSSAVCKRRCVKVSRSPWWDSARSGCDPALLAKGRHPRTGQEMWLPADRKPTFKAGKACTPSGNFRRTRTSAHRGALWLMVVGSSPPPQPQHPWRVPGWPFVALH